MRHNPRRRNSVIHVLNNKSRHCSLSKIQSWNCMVLLFWKKVRGEQQRRKKKMYMCLFHLAFHFIAKHFLIMKDLEPPEYISSGKSTRDSIVWMASQRTDTALSSWNGKLLLTITSLQNMQSLHRVRNLHCRIRHPPFSLPKEWDANLSWNTAQEVISVLN